MEETATITAAPVPAPVPTIENEELRGLQIRLKAYTTKWAKLVTEEMCKVEIVDKSKMYGIISGSVKDRRWQRIFIDAANIVLKRLEAESNAA